MTKMSDEKVKAVEVEGQGSDKEWFFYIKFVS
jgi:hypothetical protein